MWNTNFYRIQKERDIKQFVINCTRNLLMEFFFNNTHLHGLDMKYYFPVLICQKCIPVSYCTFRIPLWNSASRHRFLSQLNQFRLPVFCDEGVYRIVADIFHQKKDEFSGIIPLL